MSYRHKQITSRIHKMDRTSLLTVLIFTLGTFQLADSNHVNLDAKATNSEILNDALRQAAIDVAAMRDTVHTQVIEASNDPLIPTLAGEINDLVLDANTTFGPLGASMYAKIDATEALGPSYARCTLGQREKADTIVSDGYRNLAYCEQQITSLQVGYTEQLAFYTLSIDEVYEMAVVSMASCVPGDEPSDEETLVALSCIDEEVQYAEGRYSELSQSLVEYVISTNDQAQLIRDGTPRCVDTAKHHASDLTGYFLYTMDACVDEVNQSTSTGGTSGTITDGTTTWPPTTTGVANGL